MVKNKDKTALYDLIVIGAGSGLDVAVVAAAKGLKTAIIDKGPLGGTCLNRGCIPSKIIIHSADVAENIRTAEKYGLEAELKSINFRKIIRKANVLVDSDAASIKKNILAEKNPALFQGEAKFIGKKKIMIDGQVITGRKIVIAAGCRPLIPSIKGLNQVPYLTNQEALRLTKLPKSIIIIGGGYIAVELGYFYASIGCRITIIQKNSDLLSKSDSDIASTFNRIWKKRYEIITSAEVTRVSKLGPEFKVSIRDQKGLRTISAEQLLITTGRKPNTDILDVTKTGLKIDKKGFLITDRYLRTNIRGIYALGDIAGHHMFKHSANLEAEYVLNNLFHSKKAVDYYPLPYAIFTNPQVAGLGLTEQQVKEKKIPYVIGKYYYKDTGMGQALQEKDGFVKFIVDKKQKRFWAATSSGLNLLSLSMKLLQQ